MQELKISVNTMVDIWIIIMITMTIAMKLVIITHFQFQGFGLSTIMLKAYDNLA